MSIKERWKARSPKIFRRIYKWASGVAAVAVAVQTAMVGAGATIPHWWEVAFPYLVGLSAGMAAVAKLTREDGDNDNLRVNETPENVTHPAGRVNKSANL